MTDFEKMSFKITWIKAGALLFSACLLSFTISRSFSDWQSWRKDITKDVANHDDYIKKEQTASNQRQAQHNRDTKVIQYVQ